MSRKGNPMIKVDSYTFCKKGVSGIKSRWVCSTHNHRGCTAMVHMIQNEIVKLSNVHNHGVCSDTISLCIYYIVTATRLRPNVLQNSQMVRPIFSGPQFSR